MNDVEDVLAAFDTLYGAVEARDADALIACFVTDGDVSFWGSEGRAQAYGQAEFRDLARVVGAPGVSVSFVWPTRHARAEGDVAWLDALGSVTLQPPGAAVLTRPYRTTGVLLRRDGRWLWHTYHGSEPGSN